MYLQGVIIRKTAGAVNNKAKAKQKSRDLDILLHSKNCILKIILPLFIRIKVYSIQCAFHI